MKQVEKGSNPEVKRRIKDFNIKLNTILACYTAIDKDLEELFIEHYYKLSEYILDKIYEYGNAFNIGVSRIINDAKIAFFIPYYFEENKFSDSSIRKHLFITMVKVLNFILNESHDELFSKKVVRTIFNSIQGNNLNNYYGKYGIYITYKNQYLTSKLTEDFDIPENARIIKIENKDLFNSVSEAIECYAADVKKHIFIFTNDLTFNKAKETLEIYKIRYIIEKS